nr:L,D-transpeptidase family protein [uncultured Cohaesibacter sp.]
MAYQGKVSGKLLLTVTVLLSSTAVGAAAGTPVSQLPVSEKRTKHLDASLDAPVQIIVSRKDQRLRVFKDGEEIASSRVSTGKRGHTTPTGIYSILEKRRRHYSNLYDSAPMPYMQRLTWSGIALHESNSVPRYPASHGCVRLPNGFAKKLFSLTERGAHVVIANRDAAPELISHPVLFQPQEMTSFDKLSSVQAAERKAIKTFGKVALLSNKPPLDPLAHQMAKRLNRFEEIRDSEKPLRIFITRQAKGNLVHEVQTLLNKLGFDAGEPDGLVGKMTLNAVRDFVASKKGSIESRQTSLSTTIDQTLLAQLYQAAGKGEVPTGHLFVRHNFKPLFDAPIQIRNPEQALGAHLFTASLSREEEGKLDWRALSLGDKLTARLQDRYGVTEPIADDGIVESQDILDRIVIPDHVRAQVNHLIGNGASLTVSDRGFSRETTPQGTDFIVLTKPTLPKYASKSSAKGKKKRLVRKVTKPKRTIVKVKKPKSRGIFRLFKKRKVDHVASR